jgi:hypothetical protein
MTDLSVDAPILASKPSPALGINIRISVIAAALLAAGAVALAERGFGSRDRLPRPRRPQAELIAQAISRRDDILAIDYLQ